MSHNVIITHLMQVGGLFLVIAGNILVLLLMHSHLSNNAHPLVHKSSTKNVSPLFTPNSNRTLTSIHPLLPTQMELFSQMCHLVLFPPQFNSS